MGYFRGRHKMDIENKLNDSDIVTTADRECEEHIKNFIATNYPGHAVLSEESGESGGSAGYRWVIDPIDGTSNFFAGLPLWAISIGVEHEGRTEIGVVYLPVTGEMFHAVRGEGAFLNGKPIHVSAEEQLSRSLISTGFPVDKDVNPDNNLDNFARILPLVRDVRRLGSATVDMCYTAAVFSAATGNSICTSGTSTPPPSLSRKPAASAPASAKTEASPSSAVPPPSTTSSSPSSAKRRGAKLQH